MPTPIRVGIIANPVSARDIRRVMSHAAGLPLAERANIGVAHCAGAGRLRCG